MTEKNIVEKPWGHEEIWASNEKYVGKILFIKQGSKLSRQYHEVKDETIYVLEGTLLLEIGKDDNIMRASMKPGDTQRISPGLIHRFCADCGTDVKLIEVSTPELDDVVRIQDDYGRE